MFAGTYNMENIAIISAARNELAYFVFRWVHVHCNFYYLVPENSVRENDITFIILMCDMVTSFFIYRHLYLKKVPETAAGEFVRSAE